MRKYMVRASPFGYFRILKVGVFSKFLLISCYELVQMNNSFLAQVFHCRRYK